MKLAFVSPRYGNEIVGGAEHAVQMLAENCVRYAGVEAEIYTTTAGDERTWSARYSEGEEIVNDIKVLRFANDPIDRDKFDNWASSLLSRPHDVDEKLFDEWLKRQGPFSPGLLDAIQDCQSDAIVFHPMLSSPTSHGIFRSIKPTILHPALHDEPLSRMPGYKDVMKRADLMAFSTRTEQNLALEIMGLNLKRQSVIGFGVDAPSKIDGSRAKTILDSLELGNSSYAVVIGRVDPAKGADMCCQMFEELYSNIVGVEKIVFIGPISNSTKIMPNNKVVVAGSVDDETKWALLSNARCLISPSVTESFSLVLLEALKLGVPVVVNGSCGPTREHVENSSSGVLFTNAAEFVSAINLSSIDSSYRNQMIRNGKSYVDNFYEWESVIDRYIAAVEVVTDSVSTSS